jgi:hypothetical protein
MKTSSVFDVGYALFQLLEKSMTKDNNFLHGWYKNYNISKLTKVTLTYGHYQKQWIILLDTLPRETIWQCPLSMFHWQVYDPNAIDGTGRESIWGWEVKTDESHQPLDNICICSVDVE